MMEKLRAAWRDTIHDNPAHLKGEAIAEKMGIDASTLYRYGEIDGPLPPLKRLLEFTLYSASMKPIIAFCEDCNGTFVPMPTFADDPGSERLAVKAIREFGQFLTQHAKALEDGRVDDKELSRIMKEGDEVLLAVVLLMRRARQLHDKVEGTVVFGRRS